MQAAGGVDNDVIRLARDRGLQRIEENGGRIASGFGLDDFRSGALSPDFKLIDGGGAESIGGAEQDVFPWSGNLRELAEVVVLPVPLTPTTR